jgi:hypothetical protein
MQSIKNRFLINTIFFFLVYGLMFYVVLRAVFMDITHDEAYSFYNAKHFWWVETLCTGNTHWFNFLAIKTCLLFGLEKASQLRWFTLLSSGIFLTLIYYWIRSIRSVHVKVFAFAVSVLNPFLIDYLSLARGYSTGLMFETLSIAFYFISIKKRKRSIGTFSLLLSGMSAIANFNFFYFFAAFSIVYFFQFHFKKRSQFLKQPLFYWEVLFVFFISALVLKALHFITVCSNDIGAYGGEDLVSGVFRGFIHTLVYREGIHLSLIDGFAFVFCLGICMACIYGIRLTRKHRNETYAFSSFVLLIMIILTLVTKLAFGVLYPTYRTALMFYPLFSLVLVGFLSAIITNMKLRRVIFIGCGVVLALNFCSTLSLRRSFDYWQQSDTKKAFTYLDRIGANYVGASPELYGVYRNYYQLTDHQRFHFEGTRIHTMDPKGLDATGVGLQKFEYLVLFPPYDLSFYRANRVRFEGVMYFPNTGTLILKCVAITKL